MVHLLNAAPGPILWELESSLELGWLEYDSLWGGDLLMGGFDLSSPPYLPDRLMLVPQVRFTLRPGEKHRFRVDLDGRTLQRYTSFDEELNLVHGLASDGVPVEEAWKERLFLDEASWRYRPRGDPSMDLRLGVLPFSISGGRFLAESWPGASFRLDAGRLGWIPLALEARGATTARGTVFCALSLLHEPSLFEELGLEISFTRDSNGGITPLLEEDLGMLTELLWDTSSGFMDAHEAWVMSGLYDLYGTSEYGVSLFYDDLKTFLDLDGSASLLHSSLLARKVLGPVFVDLALVHAGGHAEIKGNEIPDSAVPQDLGDENWASVSPREAFSLDLKVSGWAWDLAISSLRSGVWQWLVFFQGMSGDPDPVAKAINGATSTLFLATDQRFLRTALFPVDTASRTGAFSSAPGLSGFGLMTPGLSSVWTTDKCHLGLQVALPMSTSPSPLQQDYDAWIYGLEGDLTLSLQPSSNWLMFVESGMLAPGDFLGDPTTLPMGWRVYAGMQFLGQISR